MEQTIADIPIPLDLERLLRGQENAQLPAISAESPHAGYYRSRLFTLGVGLNPLISAAQPLLSLLPRLVQSPVWPDELTLKDYLCHEIKAFETHAKANQVSDEMIALARIILLCTLDDKLSFYAREKQISWDSTTLQNHILRDTQAGERFFTILKRAGDYPSAHLDLLELIYTSLANGYRGIYRHQINGADQLTLIREQLYDLITDKRKHGYASYFNQPIDKITRVHRAFQLPLRRYVILVGIGISVMITGMYYTLDLSTGPVVAQLQALLEPASYLNSGWSSTAVSHPAAVPTVPLNENAL